MGLTCAAHHAVTAVATANSGVNPKHVRMSGYRSAYFFSKVTGLLIGAAGRELHLDTRLTQVARRHKVALDGPGEERHAAGEAESGQNCQSRALVGKGPARDF